MPPDKKDFDLRENVAMSLFPMIVPGPIRCPVKNCPTNLDRRHPRILQLPYSTFDETLVE